MHENSPYNKQAISVDCVVFGFDGTSLKVLLVRRKHAMLNSSSVGDYKLPGSLVANNEDLNSAIQRVIKKHIGIRDIYMRQMSVFSDPKRIQGIELNWLNEYYEADVSRVLTVTYCSLIKLNSKILEQKMLDFTMRKRIMWMDINSAKGLALDHNDILMKALDYLAELFQREPVVFELLPKYFTIRELRVLCEAAFGIEFDSRNFRKKILLSGYIVSTQNKEVGVSHKPAIYYKFDKKMYERESKKRFKLNFGI